MTTTVGSHPSSTEGRTQPITVLVADDHAVLRQGLRRLLDGQGGFQVVAEASDGADAAERAQRVRPDVVVMDFAMPRMNGLDAARAILRSAPGTKVIILSMHADRESVAEAFEAGIDGWVTKDASAETLFDAIRAVVKGGTSFGELIRADGLPAARRSGGATRDNLTPREREILQLLAEGRTVRQIGMVLSISPKTADVHKTNLMRKLDIHSRVELVKYALQKKMIRI